MSRSSLIWGPFSIVWGFGITLFTMLLYQYKEKSDTFLFVSGGLLGGRINLLYCFFWGIAAVVWMKYLYPRFSTWIKKIPIRTGKCCTYAFVIFMAFNIAVSGLALIRCSQREQGITANKRWQRVMDERFSDDRLLKIYPNMIKVK